MMDIDTVFKTLFSVYGEQGWWPVGGSYHPGDRTIPRTDIELWEILCGAVLTQNTAWGNAEMALANLRQAGIVTPARILALDETKLSVLIRPSGFFNQKTERLKMLAGFLLSGTGIPDRKSLLALKGIGAETADSMLLYAWKIPVFVVDAYTRRIFYRLGLIGRTGTGQSSGKEYEHVQKIITSGLKIPPGEETKLYSEYHALLVRHAKNFCQAKARCLHCPLEHSCKKVL